MREQWIKLHLEQGISLVELAKISGFHRNTLSLWKYEYEKNGVEGLTEKSRAPLSHHNAYPDDIKEKSRILRLEKDNRRIIGPKTIKKRMETRYGINVSRSGIAKFLNRNGLIDPKTSRRLDKKNRVKKYRIQEPGELIQMDVKYAFKSYADYWYYQYSAIDYVSNMAYGKIYEIQSSLESILFLDSLVRFYPFIVSGLQTDNHATFTNRYTGYPKSSNPMKPRLHPLDMECEKLGITHYLIDKGKPGQNGKVERFHRTCEQEFYQRETFKDLNSARKKFRDFLHYYNYEREHQGINDLTPVEKLRSIPKYLHIPELITN